MGPAIVLKVMAGDSVNLQVRSWYKLNGASTTPTSSVLTDLIAALSSGIGGVAGSKATSSQLSSSGLMSTAATDFLSTQSHNTAKPKAYVNWIFFDEQFKVVNSGADPVGADQAFPLHVQNLLVSKNGYVYIYTSNESQNVNVYFDNLQVSQVRGPLMEENHYYAFGLTMAGISSKAVGMIGNKFKFNSGCELNTEFDWNIYETPFRGYDAQVGRFGQVDPIAEDFEDCSPYHFGFNDPIGYNDPLGAYPDGPHPPSGYTPYDENGSSFNTWLNDAYYMANNGGNYDNYYRGIGSPESQGNGYYITRLVTESFSYNYTQWTVYEDWTTIARLATATIDVTTEVKEWVSFEPGPKKTQIGDQVLPPLNGFWSNVWNFFSGRTYTESVKIGTINANISWRVDANGKITGLAPIAGTAPNVGIGKGVNLLKAGKGIAGIIKGFTKHGLNQAIQRGFKSADILKIVKEGDAVKAVGRYGEQMRYSLGGNTVVVNGQGNIVTVFSNASGTANGVGKGFFIPWQ